MGTAVGFVFFTAVLIVVGVLILWRMFFWPKRAGSISLIASVAPPREVGLGDIGKETTRSFTFEEVQSFTTNFSRKIAEGRFGPVYYGQLPSGQEIAVKVRATSSLEVGEDNQFITEIHALAKIHYNHLVSLVGFSVDPTNQVLIYEFMRNASLRRFLQCEHVTGQPGKSSFMRWRTRVAVMVDAARGLQFLHTECKPVVVHRDFNSSNVMLDENMKAKVADFGVSKSTLDDDSGIPTLLKCTAGYLDPEYFTSQKLTPKSDVYSFGVVLFEIISGRPPLIYSDDSNYGCTLVEWVKTSLKSGDLFSIVDPSLEGLYAKESIRKVTDLAVTCVEPQGAKRPDMKGVLSVLSAALKLEDDHQHSHLSAAVAIATNTANRSYSR